VRNILADFNADTGVDAPTSADIVAVIVPMRHMLPSQDTIHD